MMKRGPRENQAVDVGDRDADIYSSGQRAQHSARGRTVQIKCFVHAGVICGNDEWLAVNHETNMTNETLIKNGMHGFAVVFAAVGQALNLGSGGGNEWLGHVWRVGRCECGGKSQFGWDG